MDVVIVRLQSHGHRFELPCHRQKIDEYMKRGRAHPPDLTSRIILHPSIFSNCHRKELATNANLQAAFQTTSFDTIASTILQFGEVVVNEKERQEKRNEKKELQETVFRLTRTLLLNKFTGVPPDDSDLREELRSTKEARCVEQLEPLLQAAYFASIVVRRDHLDCRRVPLKAAIEFPVEREGEWNDFLLDFDGLVVARRKSLQPPSGSAASGSEQQRRQVELEVLYDASLDSHILPRWKALLATTSSVKMFPVDDRDVDFFSRYEFQLSSPETATDVDLVNRLQALERLKRDPSDEEVAKSPSKGKKNKRTQEEEDSDEAESPKIRPAAVNKYEVMTHKQLQDLCRQNKLSTGGKKQDLIERLEIYDTTVKPKSRN